MHLTQEECRERVERQVRRALSVHWAMVVKRGEKLHSIFLISGLVDGHKRWR